MIIFQLILHNFKEFTFENSNYKVAFYIFTKKKLPITCEQLLFDQGDSVISA